MEDKNVNLIRMRRNLQRVVSELESKGYSIVTDILTPEECNQYITQYKEWLSRFGDERPYREESLTHQFRVAHAEPTWNVRLRSKPVFASIWQTENLLSSMDGVAMEEPPELGRSSFCNSDYFWLHTDQGSWREGLHAYQGAVYLEETSETDFCFRVLENSVQFHKKNFMKTFPLRKKNAGEDFYILSKEEIDWFISKECQIKKFRFQRGMVLWDSRTIHDNIAPTRGRQNSDRWRFVVLVCMVPAIWTTSEDIELKKEAYDEMAATAHWPAQGVWLFQKTSERNKTNKFSHLEMIQEQPGIAKSKDVLRLVGIEKYAADENSEVISKDQSGTFCLIPMLGGRERHTKIDIKKTKVEDT
ncbi:unnamed protein product [Mytilus coruscus]|uniref:Uncharacterized protein n=1 Tax=Mytilus coruscus TaxID=42192 RepID=A0A6J8EMH1_MYTCO|nr:unnamed protein product [Mytilus coruscus]